MIKTAQKHTFDPDIIRQLGRLDLIAKVIANGVLQGTRRNQKHGFSTEFSDFKPYVPGDDLRTLDWRIYARTDRLFVRVFKAETDLENLLLLDATASMAWQWNNEVTKLQYSTNLLATIACLCMKSQDRVGLLVHDANTIHHLPPRCRSRQLEEIFAILESLQPGKSESFPELLETAAVARRHRGGLVICSDLEENEDAILDALKMIASQEQQILLFHILDKAEEEFPFDKVTHLEDSETGQRIPVNPAAMKREHAGRVADFRQRWRKQCEEWGISYQPVHTGMDYVDVIVNAAEGQKS